MGDEREAVLNLTDQIEFKSLDKFFGKIKSIEENHSWIDYFIAPVIVAIIVLSVYAIKGVYPFGRNTIAYYDMPTQYVPFYANAWDMLRGKVGIFLCWYYGLGVPTAAGLVNFVLFPTNVFLYFTKRDNILYALSFLLMIKMILSALTMSFYCRKKYGMNTWTVCAGVLYACSGYVIQYYSNLFFLDYVILFPMIVWAFERLMMEHKYRLFVFFLFLAFIPNFQFAAMVVIYLVIKAYFVLDKIPADMRGRSIRLFAISGIIAALISACLMIPAIVLTLNSSRMDLNSGFNYMDALKTVYSHFRREKQFMMYGSEAAVGLAVLMLIKGKETVKKYWANIAMILVTGLPILLEGINLLWHFGSYKHFPIRFGYMLTFEMIIFVGTYLKNEEVADYKIVNRVAKLFGIAMIPFMAYVLFGFFKQFLHSSLSDMSSYESYSVYFLTLSGAFVIIFLIKENKTRIMTLVILVTVQAFCGCYGLIAPELGYAEGARVKYLLKSIDSHALVTGEDLRKTDRIKSELLIYEPNYGAIVEQPSIGLWAYGIASDTEKLLTETMGYHGAQSSIMDAGGTVFTDTILGVTRLLADNNNDNILYKQEDGKKGIFESVYKMPFGIVADDDSINIESKSFEFNNDLYKNVTGLSDELIKINDAMTYVVDVCELSDEQSAKVRDEYLAHLPLRNPVKDISSQNTDISETESDINSEKILDDDGNAKNDSEQEEVKNREYSLSIVVKGKRSLYLDVNDDFSSEMSIKLNGEPMYFSSYLVENSNSYPNTIYTGIASLGSYEDENVELKIYTTNDSLKGVKIGLLDIDVLSKGIEAVKKNQDLNVVCGKDRMDVTGRVYKDGTLFFPVGYSKDWHVKVNGKRAEVKPYINNAFIAVDVTKGDVDIRFTYWPQGLTIGIILSLLGFVALIILNIVMKHGGLAGKKYERLIDNISVYGFKAVAIALLVFMYVIPIYVKLAL